MKPRLDLLLRRVATPLVSIALLVFAGGCDSPEAPVTMAVSLEQRLGQDGFRSGRVELGKASGRALLGSGWRDEAQSAASRHSALVAGPEATLWLPSLTGEGSSLTVKVAAPGKPDDSFGLEVVLGGAVLGRVDLKAKKERLTFAIPGGLLRRGLNQLELRVTRLTEVKGGLNVRVFGAEIADSGNTPGRSTTLRLPAGAQLEAAATGALAVLVQDAGSLELVAEERGEGGLQLDLDAEVGREVIVTCWGENATAKIHAAWRPANLVVVVVDTLRADIIDQTETPALDALTQESVRFDQGFSHAPMTLPSHTALFSSRYPHVSGIVNNGQVVPPELPLLADWLGRGGYRTRAVASLGTLWQATPNRALDRGFEDFSFKRSNANGDESLPLMRAALDDLQSAEPFFLFAHFADPHEPYRDDVQGQTPGRILLDGEPVASFHPSDGPLVELERSLPAGKHRIEIACDELDFVLRSMNLWDVGVWRKPLEPRLIEGNKAKPGARFVMEFDLPKDGDVELAFWLADIAHGEDVQDRYGQEVERADRAIGDLVAALKSRGLWDNSLVVFTSDHGEELDERGYVGHVHTLFDEQVHVPLLVKLPMGEAWDGMAEDLALQQHELVRHIDVVPTILQVLGQAPLPGQMGTSLLESKARMLVTETHAPEAAKDKYACRDKQYKLIYTPSEQRFEMFDVAADPAEKIEVFGERGHEREAWQALLRETAERWERDGAIEVDATETERLQGLGYL